MSDFYFSLQDGIVVHAQKLEDDQYWFSINTAKNGGTCKKPYCLIDGGTLSDFTALLQQYILTGDNK